MQTHHLLLQLFSGCQKQIMLSSVSPVKLHFHQADGALTPLVTRFHPQTYMFVIPAHNVLTGEKSRSSCNKTKPFLGCCHVSIELQFCGLFKVDGKSTSPLPRRHGQTIRVMNLRMNCIAHPTFISTQLNILVIGAMPSCLMSFSIQVIFHIHNHLTFHNG